MKHNMGNENVNGASQLVFKYAAVFYIFIFLCFSVSLLKVASVITIYAQQDKLTASDAAAGDRFGDSVSISGDYAIVGAYADASSQGSAYIFKRSGETWTEIKKLTASDAAAGDRFGDEVAISGNYAIVGAYANADAGAFSGSAYVFYKDQGGVDNWGEVKKLTASDAAASDVFGFNVSIDGEYAVVGAHQNDDGGSLSGSAYVFYKDQGGVDNWGEVKKIIASDDAAGDHFGDDVSISGSVIVVGAWGDSSFAGSAYVFYKDYGGLNNWGQYKKITASDAAASDFFGDSISISGDYVVVGAIGNDDVGSDSGSAYVFQKGDFETWGQIKKLTASDIADSDNFGVDVSISGEYVVVGAYKNDDVGSDSGSAYIFYKDEGSVDNWGEQTKITADDAADSDFFGWSVSISGDYANVGAYGNDDDGALSGSSYIFYTAPSNAAPSATTLTPSQTTADIVMVTTTIADTDGDLTSSTFQYSINGIDWTNATIGDVTQNEALDGVVTSTGSIQDIDTDTDADNSVDLTIEWMVSTDLPNTATNTAQIRMTPNDGTTDGTTQTSAVFSIDTATPSPALDALTINTTSTTSVILNLSTTTDDNFSEYIIYYSTSTPVTTTSTELSSSTFSYFASSTWEGNVTTTLSSLTTNTLYYVGLWAYDSFGNSTSTASELSFYTLTPNPTNFATTSLTSSTVDFYVDSFDNFASGTSGYYFDLALFGGASVTTTGWTTSSNMWSLDSLTPNTRYTASVNYRNGDGVLAATSTLNFYTLAEVPGASTLADPTNTTVDITVNAGNNPAATEFALYNVTDSTYIDGSGDASGTVVWNTATVWGTITANDLTPNTNYEFYVKARNASEIETAFGSSATAYTAAGTPTSVTASVSGSDVTVSWSGTAAAYWVEDNSDSTRNSGWITATTYTFSGLSNGAYTFKVKGKNAEDTETVYVSASAVQVSVGGGGSTDSGDGSTDDSNDSDCSTVEECNEEIEEDAVGWIKINNGDLQTDSHTVTLDIHHDTANLYRVVEALDFQDCSAEGVFTGGFTFFNGPDRTRPFTFSDGPGDKKICVKFYISGKGTTAPYTAAINVIGDEEEVEEIIPHPCADSPPNILKIQPYNVGNVPIDGSGTMDLVKNSRSGNIDITFQTCKEATLYMKYISDEPFSDENLGEWIGSTKPIWNGRFPTLRLGHSALGLYNSIRFKLYDFPDVIYMRYGVKAPLASAALASVDPNNPDILFGDTIQIGTNPVTTVDQCTENPDLYICSGDHDEDGIIDGQDNCPSHANADQLDTDDDGLGDVCDECVDDATNTCGDTDKDKILDDYDNCLNTPNFDQLDTDSDGLGDVCDEDIDNDSILNLSDNCPLIPNADQLDTDGDGIGDVCDIQNSVCNNKIKEGDEECDTYAPEGFYCNLSCELVETEEESVCGNSTVEAGETCDDGNLISGDGCSSVCLWESVEEDVVEDNGEGEEGDESSGEADSGGTENAQGNGSNGSDNTSGSFFTNIGNGVVDTFKKIRETVANIIPEQVKEMALQTVEAIRKVIDNPQVEEVNEKIIVPAIATAGVANVAVGFQLPNIFAFLRYIFGQPLLALRRRKQKKWGIVYDAFTKQPVGLAMVRILDAQTKKVVRSQVTDAQGRYYLMLDAGEYTIEVVKTGFSGFSEYLKNKGEDAKYINLYHGESFEIKEESGELNYNIPLDAQSMSAGTKQILRDYTSKVLHYGVGLSGVVITAISFIISPNAIVLAFFFFHLLLFSVAYMFGHKSLKGGWGTVTIEGGVKKLGKVIVRVFDAEYDKLVGTGVTDRKGRYAVLVGPSTYYATYEKEGFKEKKSDTIDLSSRKTDGMGGIIGRDEKLEKE
ncbi:hypothetical protein C0581_03480 [Candidatus Parcubacteria bacterium]|nr:MAG: hypothetical protein C0581_03480 [Candidatus Parcubacteria bacterium]